MSFRKKPNGFLKRFLSASLILMMTMPSLGNMIYAVTIDKSFTMYLVPNAHIDTSWQWPFQHTADTIIPDTYNRAINALKTNADYKFSTSASKHYEYAKEYYPDYYESIKELVASGQWDITGGQIVEPDLNLAGGEALVRQSLYGQHFFEQEFGKAAQPVTAFVPDVFGFGGQFPQIIQKSEMEYFITSKLNWNDTNRNRDSDIFWWRAIDGKSDVLSYVLMKDYPSAPWTASEVTTAINRNWQAGKESGVKTAVGFYGSGDHGGGPTTAQYASPAAVNETHAATVKVGSVTDFFRDTAANEDLSNVRVHEGEMYFEYHRGTYTSWSREKKYNRQNEILAETAEKAATISNWIGAVPDNSEKEIALAWDKILVNQMHDILPGSAAPYVYYVAFNNQELAKNLLTNVRNNAVLGMAYRADTSAVEGTPVFVYNALSWPQSGEVTVKLQFDEEPGAVYLFDEGERLPATEVSRDDEAKTVTMSFIAEDVPAMGYKVFSARTGVEVPDEWIGDYVVDEENWTFENAFLKMTLNPATGNISSLVNKADGNREVFLTDGTTEANELHVYYDTGGSSWPAWDLTLGQMNIEPTYILNGAPEAMRIVEQSEEKVTVLVSRDWQGSTLSQYITMYSGIDRIDVRMAIDWQNQNHLLKVSFPVLADAAQANYEIGYGALSRSTTRDTAYDRARFEQSGHKWMDITDDSDAFGVSILNDAKYGYDVLKKTSGDQTYVRSRITALRSPMSAPLSASEYQPSPHYIESGYQEFNYSIYPHANSWEDAKTVNEAHEMNYPMSAVQVAPHDGGMGSSHSFLSSDKDNVVITAVKNANDNQADENTFIVRLFEATGRDTDVTVTLPQSVVSAREVNMLEHAYEGDKAIAVDGDKISFNIEKYEILTLEVQLDDFDGTDIPVASQSVDLSAFFNTDGVSDDDDRRDGDLDGSGNTVPARNWATALDYQGVGFALADTIAAGENNYVAAEGQTIPLPEGQFSKVFLVGAAAGTGDPSGDFTVLYTDGTTTVQNVSFANWHTDLSGWNRFEHMDTKPYVYDSIAHVFTHFHDGVDDQMTNDNYLFVYSIDIDRAKTVKSITLPEADSVKIAAVSAADSAIPGFAGVYGSSDTYIAPPEAPTNVRAAVADNGIDVTITWDPSESEDVLNYMIYGGFSEDFRVGDDTLLEMVSATRGSYVYSPDTKGTFYFKVVASDRNVQSSEPSLPSNPVLAGLYNYCLTAARVWAVFNQNVNEMDYMAADADYGTKWCATGITTANQRGFLNVQLVADDADPIVVERFKIAHAGVSEQSGYNTRDFDIDYSLDGQTWTTVVSVRGNSENITVHPLETPVLARYARLNVIAGEQNGGGTARIFEFMAFGNNDVRIKPIAQNAALDVTPLANDRVRLTAAYTFYTVGADITEGATRFEWSIKEGDEYVPLAQTTQSVTLSNSVLADAAAVRCVIYPVDNTGLEGNATPVELTYNTPGANVLLGAKLVSSSGAVNSGETADKMTDGNIATKWCQEGISQDAPGTAVFDMNAIYSLESFKLSHSAANPDAQDYDKQVGINTRAYQIETSLDGVTWTAAAAVSENMDAVTEHTLTTPVTARFIRLTVTLPNSGLFVDPPIDSQQALRVCEFEGYGDFVSFGSASDGISSFISADGEEVATLAEAAGKTLSADVTVQNSLGEEETSIWAVAALYDAEGRLADYQMIRIVAEPGATSTETLAVAVPEDCADMAYRLFIWDGVTLAPLSEATVIQ